LCHEQGGRIGRFFASWAAVDFGQFFENFTSSANLWATYLHSMYKLCIDFDKKWVGLHIERHFCALIWSPWPRVFLEICGELFQQFKDADRQSPFKTLMPMYVS
jgi:hypothetical protein